jgi:uncharacterized protein YuzB (UPF0349 family)
METKYYEYIGTQEHASEYALPIAIIGNIYPSHEEIGGSPVSFWASGSDIISKEWKLVEKELSTHELIELLEKQAAKDGLICSVTFEKKPEVEITDFEAVPTCFKGTTSLSILINLELLKVANKEKQLIEAIKNVLEND